VCRTERPASPGRAPYLASNYKKEERSMYAVIATGGKQYRVEEGDIIRVEKLGKEVGDSITFDQVLAVSNDGLKVGEDVKGATVEGKVLQNGRAKKVIVYRYKRKTGYHKKNGHRQYYTTVKIDKING
jgi:large subunit ribosomal protein L21